jgi:hypothetical protein
MSSVLVFIPVVRQESSSIQGQIKFILRENGELPRIFDEDDVPYLTGLHHGGDMTKSELDFLELLSAEMHCGRKRVSEEEKERALLIIIDALVEMKYTTEREEQGQDTGEGEK